MILVAAGAAIVLAEAQTNAPSTYTFFEERLEYAAARTAPRILNVLAEGAAAAAIYRMTDDPVEFYPVEADARGRGGARFADRLSVRRGGMRFRLTAIKSGARSGVNTTPSYRREARNMARAMPGYPQPARIVLGVKVSY
ncbi:hypothetical protein PUV54_08735 [Hyphococcus flavus]|uniref:Uncharacterized protein n=1 Tax=Hyphococcus flavus TaxID=1866326 RepID=A0AAF0CES8_9PROT|nr:hypothetical protein [Hyphococcus flavus]WDI30043.1 hypothetical protein PUV54_08735 [Hyphococcus flavus]